MSSEKVHSNVTDRTVAHTPIYTSEPCTDYSSSDVCLFINSIKHNVVTWEAEVFINHAASLDSIPALYFSMLDIATMWPSYLASCTTCACFCQQRPCMHDSQPFSVELSRWQGHRRGAPSPAHTTHTTPVSTLRLVPTATNHTMLRSIKSLWLVEISFTNS